MYANTVSIGDGLENSYKSKNNVDQIHQKEKKGGSNTRNKSQYC